MTKPSLPQGTRDFGPEIVRKRDFILHTIRSIFEIYGFQPLETPAMENLETLMGKYGEEGDKLIFKILNNGLENPAKETIIREEFEKILKGKNSKGITERALRYDLTIPFARWVAMNHKQLVFPFKRYQVQPVWRADRPQKGRYREFYQCDADVVGSTSLINELEFTHIYAAVFEKLGLDAEIKINNRKILTALAEITGGADQLTAITVAIDKLDKIGLEKVKEELVQRGIQPRQILIIENYLSISGGNDQKLTALKNLFSDNTTGKKGLEELEWLLTSISAGYAETSTGNHPVTGNKPHAISITLDPTLARGLNYYTGTIFEVKATGVKMGSIGGGGRYDDLTGLFGVPDIPGVGISFGVDRIYDVMEVLKLFPGEVHSGSQVLFFNLGEKESKAAFSLLQQLRKKGIPGEIYHESSKFEKQFKYAEKKNISFVVILGEEELKTGTCKIKNIKTGLQQEISQDDLVKKFSFF
ncbi:MAG TPA: histidine--tRNA ligase [Chitinophagaceae bacterium]|nr:histidine--tRNA ligase [Chitinophagaceae bacterium]